MPQRPTPHIVTARTNPIAAQQLRRRCPECGRLFDLLIEVEAAEWFGGHDCEVD